MADHVSVAGRRGEDVEAFGMAAGDIGRCGLAFRTPGESVGAIGNRSQSSSFKRPVWTASGSTVRWKGKGSKATSSIRPRSRPRAGAGGRRPTGSTARRWCARCWPYKRGEPRVCAMVKAPTPEDEDRRRLCRERKVLTAERVCTSTGSRDCCSRRAYPVTSRCAAIDGDGSTSCNGRRPSAAAASEGADQPRARSARTAARADQDGRGRA